ncbi:MAG: 1-(5-phosphoribosyl)-5-[(5-phosphoribosylamino)methylideneamino]imidazole-4-carboxamide isomerase [Pyrinomonadaceae bacterium]|jgi:phosphoribosylformimino-5-aminoimidazole carboxamide ribotide isomerase|nr:1-(5-phosphoribosyl)-5-[(5-phosphoribosylamino)methylideneamino]imidazole-4-carboxamide isomerase [Pyrinomonadaceae bacterium]
MIEIIPAIDLIEGKCVRLSQGDFTQKKIYNENPLEVAKEFESFGIKRLHLVDLDGAKNGKITNLKTLEMIAANTNLAIDFGGGIKTVEDIDSIFNAGASFVSIGSIAVKDSAKFFSWIEKYGSDKILLGADVRDKKLAIDGWLTNTDLEIIPFLKNYFAQGVTQVFCTDISLDGVLQGSSNELYAETLSELPKLKLIASGGVSKIEDVYELEKIGCSGVIIGKAIYEGRIKLKELKNFTT